MAEAFLSPSWHRVGPLKVRLRPGMRVNRHRVQGQAWYVLHDGATGKVHRFTPPVYAVIGAMDGARTVDEIWREAADRLGDDAPSQTAVVTLLSQLHAADLLQADIASDPAELFRRYAEQRRRDFRGRYLNPMSIRIPLIDPDRFLSATVPLVRPFIGWFGLLVWLVAVVAGALAVAPHWGELTGNLADRVLSRDGLILLALVFPVLKALHELGHAYAIKAGGGEVHEMGVMFIALLPVPYVEGSASSAFRSKWRRAGVAAAGMLVETFVAGLAALVWTMVEPGLLRAVAFNVMLIAGVSTVLFNANPLMRLDGYFIFADLVEVPNLAQRSNKFWGWLVQRRVFGADVERPAGTAAERAWFVVYAPGAYAYRIAILVAISLFLAEAWFVLGVVVALGGIFAGVVLPACKGLWHVVSAPQLQRVRGRAVALTLLAVTAIPAGLMLMPVPLRTTAEGVVWLPDDAFVRAEVDGVVDAVVAQAGSAVRRGDVLIRESDPVLAGEAAVLRAQIAALNAELDGQEFTDRVKADLTRRDIDLKQANLARAEQRLAALDVRAALSGTLEVPRADHLPGRYVKRGDVLGYVLPPSAGHVMVMISQADIDLLHSRPTKAEMLLPGDLWHPVPLTLLREIPAASDQLPSRALATDAGGQVAVDSSDPQAPRSLQRWFQLDFGVPEGAVQGQFGTRVQVRLTHGSEPLGLQWGRRIRQLLLARLDL